MNNQDHWLAEVFNAARNNRISDPEWSRGMSSISPFIILNLDDILDTNRRWAEVKDRLIAASLI